MSSSQEIVSRDGKNDKLLKELRGTTFCVDLITQGAIFYADPNNVQIVLDRIQHQYYLNIDTLFARGISTDASPRFPLQGFDREIHSYKPFVHLFNTIVHIVNETLHKPAEIISCNSLSQCYRSNIRFHTHNLQVVGECENTLKLHGFGLLGELPACEEISWEDIEVVIEVNSQTDMLVKQAATYARASLVNDRRRFFAIVIGLNHKTLEVYFLIFHRSGLSSSRPLSLRTQQGFEDVVKHIVGMLSIRDEAAYCLDVTRSQDMFCINNHYYDVDSLIYMHKSLCSRSTAVYNLRAHTGSPVFGLQSRTLSLSNDTTVLPDKLVYKLSYPIEGRAQEGLLFSKFVGQFGIVDVVGFHICGPDEPHGSTERLFRSAEFWNVFGGEGSEPRQRSLQCLALSSCGLDLLDLKEKGGGVPSPGELLETILHAIIGHCILFFGGVLHRDISIGNIMRNVRPVKRPALDMFECTKTVDLCRGFLIDGDHAIEWLKIPQSRVCERSGTFPFLSRRLVMAWSFEESMMLTAVDDLESFFWVLIWALSNILVTKRQTKIDLGIMKEVMESDVLFHTGFKFVLVEMFKEIDIFGGLIGDWIRIFDSAREDVDPIAERVAETSAESPDREEACNELESFCKRVYEAVLTSGFQHLKRINESPSGTMW